jgi:hypothetical protein
VQGVYGAEDRNVLEVHEDLSTGATQQFDDGVEFRKRSIFELVLGMLARLPAVYLKYMRS